MRKSGEDYLEAVLAIEEEKTVVRITDVANRLGVSKPSVSRAMKNLMEGGYIDQPSYGDISLTAKGRTIASQVYFRHKTLTLFLNEVLGVDKDVATHDACLIEHDISSETLEKLAAFLQAQQEINKR
ncbi:MAG: metal-dependent transcriptional regulator [Sphaerochaetaceae bacterium]